MADKPDKYFELEMAIQDGRRIISDLVDLVPDNLMSIGDEVNVKYHEVETLIQYYTKKFDKIEERLEKYRDDVLEMVPYPRKTVYALEIDKLGYYVNYGAYVSDPLAGAKLFQNEDDIKNIFERYPDLKGTSKIRTIRYKID